MKKLLMTLGIILGFTAVVSAQSVVKEAETVSTKPTLVETPKTNAVAVAVVTTEKPVVKVDATKPVVKAEKAADKELNGKVASMQKPVTVDKEKVVKPEVSKPAKAKENN